MLGVKIFLLTLYEDPRPPIPLPSPSLDSMIINSPLDLIIKDEDGNDDDTRNDGDAYFDNPRPASNDLINSTNMTRCIYYRRTRNPTTNDFP